MTREHTSHDCGQGYQDQCVQHHDHGRHVPSPERQGPCLCHPDGWGPRQRPSSMDIDQIGRRESEEGWESETWWDEEWGKGGQYYQSGLNPLKGKGKGLKGCCYHCGGSHYQRDCPNPKGKGKGGKGSKGQGDTKGKGNGSEQWKGKGKG